MRQKEAKSLPHKEDHLKPIGSCDLLSLFLLSLCLESSALLFCILSFSTFSLSFLFLFLMIVHPDRLSVSTSVYHSFCIPHLLTTNSLLLSFSSSLSLLSSLFFVFCVLIVFFLFAVSRQKLGRPMTTEAGASNGVEP